MQHIVFSIVTCAMLLCACSAPTPATVDEPQQPVQDSTAQATGNAHAELPARITEVWAMIAPERWEDHWKEQYEDSTGTLGHRHADFDGDGTADNAYLLGRKDTTDRDSTYALVIRFGNAHDTILTVEPWAEFGGYIGMGLSVEPPGNMGHLGGEEGGEPEGSVQLKQPAITLEYFEKAAITWYWKDGSFHKVWTGD